ncbi:hypothetical protein P153DRAFT_384360 [Dothidotthia symphoricarpi CBS 119687]|uniref:CENP-V/GFA domain-containing protein n=1 Tax=Dothidotthia symphoricarpi CBS 119687 TaxID=1392245 RepID=A0A6A6AJU5_9PLEO|nr:uncharacterized protein P153DRAFT_384360 [Dothidotthia symphoricarpi CBS 119687]KAF2131147.1 hypothetical protein P153DRAFT_384360 [Dothidotthia symphoricarpi CBS 119687]
MKSGEEALESYSFGVKRNLHKFYGQCGSSVFFDPRMEEFGDAPPDLLGVNVRMFQGVKVEELDVVHVEDRHPSRA